RDAVVKKTLTQWGKEAKGAKFLFSEPPFGSGFGPSTTRKASAPLLLCVLCVRFFTFLNY
ncbi:MAG: hypothetical protein KBA85_04895, partial [Chloroflexi bacterium]|nr:hypothetical protein [Chloroflexota bacterium]